MVYLKTYFYVDLEIKYLILNLLESYDYIDKFIIMEYDVTHNGKKRDFIFNDYLHLFPDNKIDKILYVPSNISKETIETNDEITIHKINEPIMRGNFVKHIELKDDDIIISVDADEIIYSQYYDKIIEYTNKFSKCTLPLNQFFFKYNYFWSDLVFKAAASCKYELFKYNYPSQWRYVGNEYPEIVGCHFSFCMSVDDMIYKINTYSHPSNKKFANEKYLNHCVENKIYPFENRHFTIIELDENGCEKLLPKNFKYIKEMI